MFGVAGGLDGAWAGDVYGLREDGACEGDEDLAGEGVEGGGVC